VVVLRRPFLLITPVLIVVLSALSASGQQLGQEFVPVDNWAYRAIERFESMGFCTLPRDRPFTRPEFVTIVSQISKAAFDKRLAARDRFNLSRLEREFTSFAGRRDPTQRFDPPLIFASDAPLYLEFDIDIWGIAAEPFFTNKTEWFLRTDPELRLHIGSHVSYDTRYRIVMGPESGDRARDEKPTRRTKSFKGLTSLWERGYVIAGWEKFHIYLGREYVDWGASDYTNLLVPGDVISLDQFYGGRIKFKSLRLDFFHSKLWPDPERWLAGHRLEWMIGRTVLGVGETTIYNGRGMDMVYMLPLASFYSNQFNERSNDDNILWNLDATTSFLDIFTVYGSLLIDDFQFERDGENPDKMGFDVGGRMAFGGVLPSTWRAHYRRVDIYTYTHHDSLNNYISGLAEIGEGDFPLGGVPGPDSDAWRVEGSYFPRGDVTLTLAVFSERRGEGNDYAAFEFGNDTDPKFPSGVVQRTIGWLIGARLDLRRNSWVRAFFTRADIDNGNNISGQNSTVNAFRVEVRWDFD